MNRGRINYTKGWLELTSLFRMIMLEKHSVFKFGSYCRDIGLGSRSVYTMGQYELISNDAQARHLFLTADASWRTCFKLAEDNKRGLIGWETKGRYDNIKLMERARTDEKVEAICRGFETARRDWRNRHANR